MAKERNWRNNDKCMFQYDLLELNIPTTFVFDVEHSLCGESSSGSGEQMSQFCARLTMQVNEKVQW